MLGTVVRFSLAWLLLATVTTAQDRTGELRLRLRGADADAKSALLSDIAALGHDATALVPEVVALLAVNDLSLQHDALITLGQLGDVARAAVPAVTKLLQSKEPLLQQQALIALREIGPAAKPSLGDVEKLLLSSDRSIAVEAAATSIALSDKPSDAAVKTLLQALADGRPSVRSTAVHWLAVSHGAKIDQLLELLKSGATATKISVAELLGELRGTAAPAVEALAGLAGDTQPTLQATVARSLGEIGEKAEVALPALATLAKSSVPNVRGQALLALGKFGRRAADQIELLQHSLKDAEAPVRMAAAEALAAIGPAAAAAVPSLSEALKDAEGSVTIRAAEALGRIGSPAVAALTKTLDDPHYGELALQTLATMGPAAKPALPRLLELLKQKDKLPQRELCLAIAAIGADPRTAGPILRAAMNDAGNPDRAAAAYALGRIGDKAAIKDITNVIESDDPKLRLAAAWSLLQFDPGNDDYLKIALPRLIEGLSQPEAPIRYEAARTLGQLGPKAAAAQAALVERLATENDRQVRIAMAVAVAELGPGATMAVPSLIGIAKGSDVAARRAAMYSLGRIGSPAAEAVPVLLEKVQSGPVADRALAGWALLQIRAEAADVQAALPTIVEAIGHERPEVIVQLARVAGRVGQNRPEVRQVLETLKKSDDPALRAAAWSATDRWETRGR
ncbi:MAG: HEAT repeat domain-containing protein [Planctomycetaceae bacterium]|nr:HEAT repeat domain-containing protein [Planctomycetaceae bacterium]